MSYTVRRDSMNRTIDDAENVKIVLKVDNNIGNAGDVVVAEKIDGNVAHVGDEKLLITDYELYDGDE